MKVKGLWGSTFAGYLSELIPDWVELIFTESLSEERKQDDFVEVR